MNQANCETRSTERQKWLCWERIRLYSAALFILQAALFGIWIVSYWGLHKDGVPLPGSDFRVFWCASEVSLHHEAAAAFDNPSLLACEASLQAGTPMANMFAPWIYPPTFHLLVYPLALLPYAVSYAFFMAIGIAVCLLACMPTMKKNALPWTTVAAFPGIWVAMVHGQNSLLTLGLAAGALAMLETAPGCAGICAGMLIIKPQLGILFPLFFLCGRHYRACAATILTAGLFCTASGVLLGWSLWIQFFQAAAWFQDAVLSHNDGGLWRAMPTVFAFMRAAGAGTVLAYAVHSAIALMAVLATSMAWARGTNRELLAAATIVNTLMIQPYLVYYDLAWLLLPVVHVCVRANARHRSMSLAATDGAIMTLAWFTPLLSFLMICCTTTTYPLAAFLPPAWLILILVHSSRDRAK
ncbi:glycosyltransferase family 87 protein [Paraburkholderia heleia]|uniref:glycosyltransferase family 87 protein n=1 Tax=Paraburkholderia heleia TaxID=634127 RepID=UPI002AB694ED|nr:glycosyltransferase family 87 protein [Paraburkholderia heleia]